MSVCLKSTLYQKEFDMEKNIKRIADHYGLKKQQRQLSEECAELIQATSKYMRYLENSCALSNAWEYITNIVGEVADVEIMLEQIKYLLNIDKEAVEKIKQSKLERQLARIKKER